MSNQPPLNTSNGTRTLPPHRRISHWFRIQRTFNSFSQTASRELDALRVNIISPLSLTLNPSFNLCGNALLQWDLMYKLNWSISNILRLSAKLTNQLIGSPPSPMHGNPMARSMLVSMLKTSIIQSDGITRESPLLRKSCITLPDQPSSRR